MGHTCSQFVLTSIVTSLALKLILVVFFFHYNYFMMTSVDSIEQDKPVAVVIVGILCLLTLMIVLMIMNVHQE